MIRKSFITLAALLVAAVAGAQEVVPANESFPLLVTPRDAALAGMAGAGDASTSGSQAYAAFSNPATLPLAQYKLSAGLSYARWAPARELSLSHNMGGAVAARFGRVGISAGAFYQAHPALDLGDDGTYARKDLLVAAGAGILLSQHFSLGLAVRYAQERLLADYKLSAVAFTGMLQYQWNALNVAAGVANLGAGAKSENGTVSPLPASARLAVDYALPLGPGSLELALDGDYYFIGKLSVAGGVSYDFKRIAFLRAGYRYAAPGAALPSYLSLGAGVRYRGIHADVTWLTASPSLANTLLVGIGIDL